MTQVATKAKGSKWFTVAHRSAINELNSIPSSEATSIKAIAQEASKLKKPSNHPDIRLMRHSNNMSRIRSGQYRALCDLKPPNFRLLLVDQREYVYDRIEEAKSRQTDH